MVACVRCINVGLRAVESGAVESVVQEVRVEEERRREARMRQGYKPGKKVESFYFFFSFCSLEL